VAITLPAQVSTEMLKKGYKPRVGIAISSMNEFLSVTETFSGGGQTYTGKSTGAPSIKMAVEPTGGYNKVTSFNINILNQELFSNIFSLSNYPNPEDTEAIVTLWFDDGTTMVTGEGVQLFKGKIKDFPSITYDSVSFQIETDDDITDRMLGDFITQADLDTSIVPTIPDASAGKVIPISYGDHTGMKNYGYNVLADIHFNQSHSIWPCLWAGEDGSGDNRWMVANHTVNEPNLPTTVGARNFWAFDDDLGRFVLVLDSHITAVTAPPSRDHVGVKLVKGCHYIDIVLPTEVSDISASLGDGTASVSGDDNAIDKDVTTKAVHSVTSSSADSGLVPNKARLSFGFPQSYPVADDDIVEVRVYAVVATTVDGQDAFFNVNGTNVYDDQNLNTITLEDCGTDEATYDGVISSVTSNLEIPRAQGGNANYAAGAETYFVWKRVIYKKTEVTGKDENDDPVISPMRLPLYCAGKGMEYGSWVTGRSQGTAGNMIENGSGVIESLIRDHVGLTNIRNADFDAAYSRLSGSKFQFYIDKQTKTKKMINILAKQCRSSVFFDFDNQLSMRVFPSEAGNPSKFSVADSHTPGSTDVFNFDPAVSGGSFTQHPIIRDSFSIQKTNNKLVNDITINYAKSWNDEYVKTVNSSDTTYVSSDYKVTENHDFTSDQATAEGWRNFILLRGKRKYWTVSFKTFMNGMQLELFDIINIRHPIINGLFGGSEENKKKWVVYSIVHSLGPYEITVKATELERLTTEQ
tara:strand:+ start:1020 stop:3269 length:2250 start_codon:yes stop_codon:yes gene_type:complete